MNITLSDGLHEKSVVSPECVVQERPATAMNTASLRVAGLKVAYGRHSVIPGLDLPELTAGSVTALLGPNGSGKSTLLRTLGGLTRAQAGSVRLGTAELAQADAAARAQHVVYMPQSLPRPVHLSVFESVLVAAQALQRTRPDTQELERVQALLQHLGIGHLAQRHLDELSGGQRQLAALAQALVRRPRVLLLDEPLSALDLNYQYLVMDLLRQETRLHGLVTLVVLHDLNTAFRHVDRALLLHQGRLLCAGAAREVITPATLAQAYGVDGRIEFCSQGYGQVQIDGLLSVE